MRPRDRYAPSPRVKFSAHTNSSSRSVVFSSRFLPRVVSRVVGFVFFVCVSRTPSPSRLARFLVVLPRSAPPSFVDASPPRLVRSIRALLLPPFPRLARVTIARRGGIPSRLSRDAVGARARRFQTNERDFEIAHTKRCPRSPRNAASPPRENDDLNILFSDRCRSRPSSRANRASLCRTVASIRSSARARAKFSHSSFVSRSSL